MRIRARHTPARPLVTLWFLTFILALPVAGTKLATARQPEPTALVRIGFPTTPRQQVLARGDLPVYYQGNVEGQAYAIAPLTAEQQAAMANQDYPLDVLDADTAGAAYYLVVIRRPLERARLQALASILAEIDDRQALVRVPEREVQDLLSAGLDLQRLNLHPLAEPSLAEVEALAPAATHPLVAYAIQQVDRDTIYQHTGNLSGEWPTTVGGEPFTIRTRYTYASAPIEKATQYAYEHFQSLGLETEYHYYTNGSASQRNVVAEQRGLEQPNRIVLLTAHLDSAVFASTGDPYEYAPGADDNASGSVGVLVAADILSRLNFNCTMRYVLFTGEEQGLLGSEIYAQEAYENGDAISGVLNLDMIGYNSDEYPFIELHTRPGNAWDMGLANLFASIIATYQLDLDPLVLESGIGASDHASFWDYGFPAILAIEDEADFTPYYHTPGDRLQTLNLDYYTEFVRAAVATFATMGCLREPGTLSGTVSNADTGAPVAGAELVATDSQAWQWPTSSDSLGNYQLVLADDTYSLSAQAVGFLPASFSELQIAPGSTTMLDIALQSCYPVGALDFQWHPALPEAGQTVVFTATQAITSTLPISYTWAFGDGETAQGQMVSHTYNLGGSYGVQLAAENCAGQTQTSHPVSVSGTPAIALTPESVSFSTQPGTSLSSILMLRNTGTDSLTWSLQEDPVAEWLVVTPTSGSVPAKSRQLLLLQVSAPAVTGVYTTQLQIASNDPRLPTARLPVTLTVSYQALAGLGFSYSPLQPWTDLPVEFSASLLSGSSPVTYTWDFGDGGAASGKTTTHSFAAAGSYTVTLYAENPVSQLAVFQPVQVSLPPEIAFTPDRIEVELTPGQQISRTLAISNSGADILEWQVSADPPSPWLTLEDQAGAIPAGEESILEIGLQAPLTAGIYSTTLQFTSNAPAAPTLAVPVVLNVPFSCQAAAGADFGVAPAIPRGGEPVDFVASVTQGSLPLTYTWDFGDQSRTEVIPDIGGVEHIFPLKLAPETYTVTLLVSNPCSSTPPIAHAVTVWPFTAHLPLVQAGVP